MGARLSFGWVSTSNDLNNEHNALINSLRLLGVSINCIKYASDPSGFVWIIVKDHRVYAENKFLSSLKEFHYLEIQVSNFPFGKLEVEATIKLEVENNYFGYLVEMEEKSILSSYKIKELETAEEIIVHYLKLLFKNFNVDYAFSDHEAEIEFSPEEFMQLQRPYYAIEAKHDHGGKVKITKANWYINGVTQRL